MQNIKTRFIVNTVFFFLVYSLVFYIIVRAFNIVITHDEAYSFYNVKHFWYVETLCTGNTHWFNFLAFKTAVLFNLEKVSQLRWFSIFCSGVFLTGAYFWIKSIKDIPTKVFAFSFALLNPYLIDYLSLARGYSAGIMFEVLMLICYCLAVKNNKRSLMFLSLFFAGMSAIANFNFFYVFTAFSLVYFYENYFKHRFLFFKNKQFYFDLFFLITITALVLKALRFITLCSNDIGAYGGNDLATSIFSGFIETLIYRNFNIELDTLNILAYILFSLLVVIAIYGILKGKKHTNVWFGLSCKLFLIILFLLIFNKLLLGILYPTYRTALFFYPLIALVVIGFANFLISKSKIGVYVLYIFSIIIVINFMMSISLSKIFDYSEQRDSKITFTYLESVGAKKVGIDPFLYGVFRNYYQQTDNFKFSFKGDCLNMFKESRPNYGNNKLSDFDYLVLYPPYNLSYYKNSNVKFKGNKYYLNTGTLVIKVLSQN
jgi:hypothetical protein